MNNKLPNEHDGLFEVLFANFDFKPAEFRVAKCLLLGRSNACTANELGLAVNTIKQYATIIYRKTGVSSRAEFLTKFQSELTLLKLHDSKMTQACDRTRSLLNEANRKLLISSTHSYTINEISNAFKAAIAELNIQLSPEVSRKLLKELLAQLRSL